METNLSYESPEIFELGKAEDVTLGWPDLKVADGCDCTKDATPSDDGGMM
jgi:hypothetical protein